MSRPSADTPLSRKFLTASSARATCSNTRRVTFGVSPCLLLTAGGRSPAASATDASLPAATPHSVLRPEYGQPYPPPPGKQFSRHSLCRQQFFRHKGFAQKLPTWTTTDAAQRPRRLYLWQPAATKKPDTRAAWSQVPPCPSSKIPANRRTATSPSPSPAWLPSSRPPPSSTFQGCSTEPVRMRHWAPFYIPVLATPGRWPAPGASDAAAMAGRKASLARRRRAAARSRGQ